MYSIYSLPEAIREIQRYLLEISFAFDWLPVVSIDGIYGDRTRNAVRVLQGRYGLPETGAVNKETFRLLYDKFIEAEEKNKKRR